MGVKVTCKTVISAFDYFLKEIVNLDNNRTIKARSSRDWLINQINLIGESDEFPNLYAEKNIFFGSFARRTKIRELDDIDIMICLLAEGSTYNENSYFTENIEINVPNSNNILQKLCHDGSNRLNSTKVINLFLKNIKNVNQYSSAEIHKNHEALTLKLKSYEWNFDIVPCFFTTTNTEGKTYYIIPDGSGYWKKTDPRIDRDNLTNLNQYHDGNILNVIRLIKYWNRKKSIGIKSSYLLENIVINYYKEISTKCTQYPDIEMKNVLKYLKTAIFNNVPDPKNIQGNLNNIEYNEACNILNKVDYYYKLVCEARELEGKSDMKQSIKKWREVLGDDFPDYE